MKHYKLAKIYKGAAKGQKPSLKQWYVYYYYNENYFRPSEPPKWKRFRLKEDINLTKFVHEREDRADAVCSAINHLLRNGFNPFKDTQTNVQVYKDKTDKPKVIDMLQWAVTKKKVAHKTELDIKSILKLFNQVVIELNYNVEPQKVTKVMMREIIEAMVEKRGLGGHAYDKYRVMLGVLFEVLCDWEKITENPCRFKSKVKVPKPKSKALLTEVQRAKIKEHILNTHPNFFNYLMMLNMTAIRPVELMRLKVGDVDMVNKRILLRADLAKDKEDRIVIIPEALEKYLNLDGEKDWYLFGKDFTPQPRNKPMSRDKATHLWQQLVIKDLKIESKMYWLKHLGLTSMRQQGIDPEIVQLHAGHSSYEITQKSYVSTDRPEIIKAIRERKEDF